ncbi:hypothetical protein VCHA53O466_50526 [Vibrio chagasii]|nr:hypothetical protein VCHA53O466_50526 [Vibrio chagasii]
MSIQNDFKNLISYILPEKDSLKFKQQIIKASNSPELFMGKLLQKEVERYDADSHDALTALIKKCESDKTCAESRRGIAKILKSTPIST